MKYVLDANALIAFFDSERGHLVIQDILLSSRELVTIHSLNACEVFYHFWRMADHLTANRVLRDMVALGIEMHDELDPSISQYPLEVSSLRPITKN
ncbi:MAG: hypothetical protein Q8922_05180 [Bacteroidota bacterium]|nr:hypothetical protein [Bacteroidota bacterium]MDP4231906.1 hypothetical protein [Bacteroidota bacterium]MDP4241387.1 hypothetical protein [Bacteroidota bacterium]MDP4287310.1 hypothetical protein [Bacteroidota bacterium]